MTVFQRYEIFSWEAFEIKVKVINKYRFLFKATA